MPGVSAHWLWIFALLAALTEYAGVLGLMVGASRRYDGPMGKSERAFVIAVLGVGLMCVLASDVATWLATAGRIVVLPLRMPVRTLEQR
ncbi:hypothetical protein FQK02_02665 [Xanthomonas vasicola]|uniref:Uncharacterized protein n=1 Tax=Xanthomonas vasicola pv. vasculorum NCPPB 890 TaxID=1184265 RepID=A0A836P427_XANVA|nr:hypothetical protein NX80_018855 [Xanthomonas vasicola pv. arecae]KFA22513.1 hypothetical protein KW5_0123495 [Xanthomonas vasicola pv. vasculorum NCPPB 1326]KFA32223.1 hypothetical protein KWG_0108470 [Xanthomonas vasicola pv. vasculorum NCPPB 1381]KFA36131.1 hypothetical protein KWI_0110740 [Xanthomonas vasicola pv. vasculorum NCPPB 206]MBV6744527.1 hypothetical protein [Xanthomonas vasicola pv. vasculorum NCPPB 890]MBV6890141.1 hypothetical protein [Xanthomonas vasicola pv. vasculorum]T